jgi:hypothetical protein
MPTFITIGYGDQAGYDRTAQAVGDAAHRQDAKLRSEGAVMGIAGAPVQVRNPDAAGLDTRDGPYMRSSLPVAGFAAIELWTWPKLYKKSRKLRAPLRMASWKYGPWSSHA